MAGFPENLFKVAVGSAVMFRIVLTFPATAKSVDALIKLDIKSNECWGLSEAKPADVNGLPLRNNPFVSCPM